jgi:undecaprenyl-diphosphatase
MLIIQIVVLALIQGITEFLPISSSGHLILVPILTGWPDQGVVTDMVTNVGTLLAVIVYFWRDVVAMMRGAVDVLRREQTRDSRLVTNVVIGTIPIILAGLALKLSGLDQHIRSATLVAVNLIVFGILLYVADVYGLMRRTMAEMNWKTSLIIGFAQALSLSRGPAGPASP